MKWTSAQASANDYNYGKGEYTQMKSVQPVLLAGGSGTRLWPLSRKNRTKQFSKLIGDDTLFQQSAKRHTSSDLVKFTSGMVLTNSDFRFIVAEQLQSIGINPGPILIEPSGRKHGTCNFSS